MIPRFDDDHGNAGIPKEYLEFEPSTIIIYVGDKTEYVFYYPTAAYITQDQVKEAVVPYVEIVRIGNPIFPSAKELEITVCGRREIVFEYCWPLVIEM